MKIPTLKEMMQAGLHFGHKTSKWNPKMQQYIYTARNGVHILNLEKTKEKLEYALDIIKETAKKGGVILFLGTKKQTRKIVEKYAKEAEMPWVTEHWIGGTITNFQEIYKLIKKLDTMEQRAKEENYEKKYTKWERGQFDEEMRKLKIMIGGIRNIKKVPDLIFISSTKDEKIAVKEALVKKVKTVGVVDTNANPDDVSYPIPANDDAIKSIEMIVKLAAEAVKEGRKDAEKSEVSEISSKQDK